MPPLLAEHHDVTIDLAKRRESFSSLCSGATDRGEPSPCSDDKSERSRFSALRVEDVEWLGPTLDDSGKIIGGIIDPDIDPSEQPIDVQFYLYLLGEPDSWSPESFDAVVRIGAGNLSRYRDANQGLYMTQMSENKYWASYPQMELQFPWPVIDEYRILALGALGRTGQDDMSLNDARRSLRPLSGPYGPLCRDAVLIASLKGSRAVAGHPLVKTNIRAPIPSWIDRQHYTNPVEFATLIKHLYDPGCHLISLALEMSSTYCGLTDVLEQRDLHLFDNNIVCDPEAEDHVPDRYWLLGPERYASIFGHWWEYTSDAKRTLSMYPRIDRDAERLKGPAAQMGGTSPTHATAQNDSRPSRPQAQESGPQNDTLEIPNAADERLLPSQLPMSPECLQTARLSPRVHEIIAPDVPTRSESATSRSSATCPIAICAGDKDSTITKLSRRLGLASPSREEDAYVQELGPSGPSPNTLEINGFPSGNVHS